MRSSSSSYSMRVAMGRRTGPTSGRSASVSLTSVPVRTTAPERPASCCAASRSRSLTSGLSSSGPSPWNTYRAGIWELMTWLSAVRGSCEP